MNTFKYVMKKSLFVFALVSIPFIAEAAIPEKSMDLWGTKMTWAADTANTVSAIEGEMKKTISLSRAYDPDCFYGTKAKECETNPDAKLTTELTTLSEELKKELGSSFDVNRSKDGKTFRDFGGMAQGYVLGNLKSNVKGAWTANFGGDILVSAPMKTPVPLVINDYEIEGLRYADVQMKSGWLLGSTTAAYGSKVVDPSTGKLKGKGDFKKIVLLAKPEFSGARLDAWSTGIIVGGRELLNKLWNDKTYQGSWAYFYVDADNNPFCSTNLKCNLYNKNGRTIVAPW